MALVSSVYAIFRRPFELITALKDVGPRGKYCLHGGCFPTGKVQATDSNTKSTQYPLAEETMMSVLMQCKYAEEILVQHKSGGKQYKHHCIRKLNAHKHKHRCIYVYAIYSIFCIYISSIYTRTIFFFSLSFFCSQKKIVSWTYYGLAGGQWRSLFSLSVFFTHPRFMRRFQETTIKSLITTML